MSTGEVLDLERAVGRAQTGCEWLKRDVRQQTGEDWMPLSLREHFDHDWPALLAALAEAQRREELMRPVVEAAKVWRQITRLVEELGDGRVSRPSKALIAAVDTYETQTGGTE